MSIVAWDGKILAADRQASYNDTIHTVQKLWKLDNGEVVAVVGSLANGLLVNEWYTNGAKKEEYPECQKEDNWAKIIVVSKEGCFYYDDQRLPIRVIDPFCAWGIGRDVALGVMEMGGDAIKAVEIASKYKDGCGRGCDYVAIENPIIKTINRW